MRRLENFYLWRSLGSSRGTDEGIERERQVV